MVTEVLHPVFYLVTFKVGYLFILQKLHKSFLLQLNTLKSSYNAVSFL